MRTSVSMESHGSAPRLLTEQAVTVAVSASSPVWRAKIERMAMDAGAIIAGEGRKSDLLLLGIDGFRDSHASLSEINRLASTPAPICVIWCGDAPPPAAIAQWQRAGIAGILSVNIAASPLNHALSAIQAGLRVIDSRLALHNSRLTTPATTPAEELTHREQEVLTMMGEGLANKEISVRLDISTHTVKFHISSILGKLGAASRTEAVSIGLKTGRLTI